MKGEEEPEIGTEEAIGISTQGPMPAEAPGAGGKDPSQLPYNAHGMPAHNMGEVGIGMAGFQLLTKDSTEKLPVSVACSASWKAEPGRQPRKKSKISSPIIRNHPQFSQSKEASDREMIRRKTDKLTSAEHLVRQFSPP